MTNNEIIKDFLKEKKVSIKGLSELLGVTSKTIYNIFNKENYKTLIPANRFNEIFKSYKYKGRVK
jgi:transcriptional antiterminator